MLFVSYQMFHRNLAVYNGRGDIFIANLGVPETQADVAYVKRSVRAKIAAAHPEIDIIEKGHEGDAEGFVQILFWAEMNV